MEDKGLSTDSAAGVWRIPSLRNVSLTAPYFHNGSVDNLQEAVRIMARVQLNKTVSSDQETSRSIIWSDKNSRLLISEKNNLSDAEVSDIVEFLKSLAGDISG